MVETESFIAATLTGTRATSMQAESAWVITEATFKRLRTPKPDKPSFTDRMLRVLATVARTTLGPTGTIKHT